MTELIVIDSAAAALPDLAARINAAVSDANQHARSAVDAALFAGGLLADAKAQVQHGQWKQWVDKHCTVALRTAQTYMRLRKRILELPPTEAQRVADLSLRKAMAAISVPVIKSRASNANGKRLQEFA